MDLITLILACSLYANNSVPYAMVQTQTGNNPLSVVVNNQAKQFTTEAEAVSYTQAQMAQGKNVNIGLMHISSQWLSAVGADVADLYRPCKNMVIATQIMNLLQQKCQMQTHNKITPYTERCMLSMYITGDSQTGRPFADTVLTYAMHHPFAPLAQKIRDPAMLAASKKPTFVARQLTPAQIQPSKAIHSKGGVTEDAKN